MGKIGKPLVVETAKPRIHTKTLPEPQPESVPEEQPEKEKVPSEARRFVSKEVGRTTEAILKKNPWMRGNMAPVSVPEQVYNSFEKSIPRLAKFFNISEQRVIDELATLVARLSDMLHYLRGEKVRLLGNSLRRS